MGRILIGISSWADPELIKSGFYPPELKTPEERLHYYSLNFPIVELDSSYHYLPTRRNLSAWIAATSSGFVFDVKAFSLREWIPGIRKMAENVGEVYVIFKNKHQDFAVKNARQMGILLAG